jgi:integrase
LAPAATSDARCGAEILRHLFCAIASTVKAEESANKPATVRELGRKWLAEYIATRRNERCAKEAESRFRRFIAPMLGHLEVSQVRPDHFRRLRLEAEHHGLAPVSVGHVLGDARCLFRYIADELRLIPRSPFPSRIMPRVEEVTPRRLSRKEIGQVLRSVPEEHGFIIRLALATGLRWGEVYRLQWRRVDWDFRQLVIERTKSGKVRRVPVTGETLEMLRQQFADSKSMFVSPYRKKDSGSFLHFVKKRSGLKAFGFDKPHVCVRVA